MRRYNRFCGGILLVLSAVSLAVSPALAGIGKGNGEIGFDFGFAQLDDEITDDSGGRFSFRGGYFFSDLFQLENQVAAISVPEAESTNVNVSLSTFLSTLSSIFIRATRSFPTPWEGSARQTSSSPTAHR